MAFSSRSRARKPVLSSLLLSGGALLLSLGARADVYHPVVNGETIASVAAKYGVTTDALRVANGLTGTDSTSLGSMLLRVPGVNAGQVPLSAPRTAPVVAPVVQTPSFSPVQHGGGSMVRAVMETVREGDTWDSIASRFRAAGNDVSVEALRRRNGDIPAPVAGQNVVVPLGQLVFEAPRVYAPRVPTNAPVGRAAIVPSYTASAQTSPSSASAPSPTQAQSEPRSLGGGVFASGEFPLGSSSVPVSTIREIPQQAPIFGSTSVVDTRRGSLSSRGGYGQMARSAQGGEVRVLGQNENAPAQKPDSAAMSSLPVKPSGSMARVGQVSGAGAHIRRLPQASAATLYKCAQGTRLAVLRQSGAWSAVLMSDRSTGWLPTKYLSMTEQTVDVSSQIVATPGPGGSVSGAGARYAAQSPMVAQALRWLGTPYVYGGTTRRGIDCSSLVQHSFAACGIQLPRTAATQARIGTAIAPADLRAGDRLYFSASGTRIDHTGLYMGNGLFVHASGSGHRVMVSNLFESRNWNIFVGARR